MIDKSIISISITKKSLSFMENPTSVYDGNTSTVEAKKEIIKGLAPGEDITFIIETGNKNVQEGTLSGLSYTYRVEAGTDFSNYAIDQAQIDRARIIPRTLTSKSESAAIAFFAFPYGNKTVFTKVLDMFEGFLTGDATQLEVTFKGKEVGSAIDSYRFVKNSSSTYNYQFSSGDQARLNTTVLSPKKVMLRGPRYYVQPVHGSFLQFALDPNETFGERVIATLGGEILPLQDGQSYLLSEWKGRYMLTTNNSRYEATDISDFSGFSSELVVKQHSSPASIPKDAMINLTTDANGYIYGCVSESGGKIIDGTVSVQKASGEAYSDFTLWANVSGSYCVQHINTSGQFTNAEGGLLYLVVKGDPSTTYKVKVSRR